MTEEKLPKYFLTSTHITRMYKLPQYTMSNLIQKNLIPADLFITNDQGYAVFSQGIMPFIENYKKHLRLRDKIARLEKRKEADKENRTIIAEKKKLQRQKDLITKERKKQKSKAKNMERGKLKRAKTMWKKKGNRDLIDYLTKGK